MNNEKLQGSVATLLTCGGLFNYNFTRNLPLSLPVTEFLKSVNILAKLQRRRVIVSRAMRLDTVLLNDTALFISDLIYDRL